jgi:hypothetical protein
MKSTNRTERASATRSPRSTDLSARMRIIHMRARVAEQGREPRVAERQLCSRALRPSVALPGSILVGVGAFAPPTETGLMMGRWMRQLMLSRMGGVHG